MATGEETERRAGRALGRARQELERRGAELARRAQAAARSARDRMERGRMRAGPEGWRPARMVAGAAGFFLLWRALFGRGLARIPAGIAGLVVLSSVFPGAFERRGRRAGRGRAGAKRGVEVVEVKSPAEMEKGAAPGSPAPTSPRPRGEPPASEDQGSGI